MNRLRLLFAASVVFFVNQAVYAANEVLDPEGEFKSSLEMYRDQITERAEKLKRDKIDSLNQYFENAEKNLQENIRSSNQQLELSLLKFLRENPKHDFVPYAYFQLATLYFQLAETDLRFFELAEHYLTRLTGEFPKFLYFEQALYLLAYSQLSQAKETRAVATFQLLNSRFPNSTYIDESNLRIAEFLFHSQEYSKAEKYYLKIVKKKEASPFYDKALYKLAWSYYLLKAYDLSLGYFLQVTRLTKGSPFQNEATDYIAFSLDKLSPGEKAVDLLRGRTSLGCWEKACFDGILRYGAILSEQKRHRTASYLYQRLSDLYPNHSQSPLALNLAMQQSKMAGENIRTAELARLFLGRYIQRSDMRREALFENAAYHYEAARRAKSGTATSSVNLAQSQFTELIRDYPDSPQAYDAGFFNAELDFMAGKTDRALLGYESTLRSTHYGHFFQAALSAIVSCHEAALVRSGNSGPAYQQLRTALLDKLQRGSNASEKPQILLRVGEVAAAMNNESDATYYFARVLNDFPNDPLATKAGIRTLTLLASKGRTRETLDWAASLKKRPLGPDLVKQIDEIDWEMRLSLAENLVNEGREITAANYLATLAKAQSSNERQQLLAKRSKDLYLGAQLPGLASTQLKPERDRADLISLNRSLLMPQSVLDLVKPLESSNPVIYWHELALTALYSTDSTNAPTYFLKAHAARKTNSESQDFIQARDWLMNRREYRRVLEILPMVPTPALSSTSVLAGIESAMHLGQEKTLLELLKVAKKRVVKWNADDKSHLLTLQAESITPLLFSRKISDPAVRLEQQSAVLKKIESLYLNVIKLKQPFWTSRALNQLGDLYLDLGGEFRAAGDPTLGDTYFGRGIALHKRNQSSLSQSDYLTVWNMRSHEKVALLEPANQERQINLITLGKVGRDLELFEPILETDLPRLPDKPIRIGKNNSVIASDLSARLAEQLSRRPTGSSGKSNQPLSAVDYSALEQLRREETQRDLGLDGSILEFLAGFYYRIGRYEMATGVVEQIVNAKNSRRRFDPQVWLLRGNALLRARKYEAAARSYRSQLTYFGPSDQIELNLAECLLGMGENAALEEWIHVNLAKGTLSPRFVSLMHRYYLKRGQSALAQAILNDGAGQFSGSPLLMGDLLALQLDQIEKNTPTPETADLFNGLIKEGLTGNRVATLAHLGRLYVKAGDFKNAESAFERAITLSPERNQFFNLATVKRNLGKTDEARVWYRRYLDEGGRHNSDFEEGL